MQENSIPISEVTIKVPWGHIAGKAWGYSNGHPVLALHGWLDNAGSFDKLIPLLSRDLYVVAIDWPGHGLSSPHPIGELYHQTSMMVDLKYVIEGLGWDRFSILAHSLGAMIAITFAACFPEYFDRMVLIEGVPVSLKADDVPYVLGEALKKTDTMQQKTEVVYPSQEACIARLMSGNSDLTKEAATTLAERGTAPVDNGFVFTRDIRVKHSLLIAYYTEEIVASYMQSIQCPVLVILGKTSAYDHDQVKTLVKLMSQGKMMVVPGNHQVHLNHAERVAPAVNEYLVKALSRSFKSQL